MRGITRAIPDDATDPGFCCPKCGRGKLYEQPYGFMFECCREAFAARIREVAQAALTHWAQERAITGGRFCCPQCGQQNCYTQPHAMRTCCREAFAERIREAAQAALTHWTQARVSAAN